MVLIDDGRISLRVTGLTDTDVITKVEIGGKISTHKGVNIPNVSLDMPYISKQDASDLLFGIEQGVDFVSASFVRKKEDVIELRRFLVRIRYCRDVLDLRRGDTSPLYLCGKADGR